MNMRKICNVMLATGMALGAGSVMAAEETDTFTATATLQAGLEVTCNAASVDFGTISVPANYAGGDTVTVGASAGATASSTNGDVVVSGGSPVDCSVNNVQDTATAALSGASGTFSGTTLAGITLTDSVSTDTLTADIEISSTSAASGSSTLYMGGTLTVADTVAMGTYTSADITLTVTE